MAEKVEDLILHQLRALDAKIEKRFEEIGIELKEIRKDQEARDAENAAILGALVSDVASIKEAVFEFVLQNKRLGARE